MGRSINAVWTYETPFEAVAVENMSLSIPIALTISADRYRTLGAFAGRASPSGHQCCSPVTVRTQICYGTPAEQPLEDLWQKSGLSGAEIRGGIPPALVDRVVTEGVLLLVLGTIAIAAPFLAVL